MTSIKKTLLIAVVANLAIIPQVSIADQRNPIADADKQLYSSESLEPRPTDKQLLMFTVFAAGSPIGNPARIWSNGGQDFGAVSLCDELSQECFAGSTRINVLSYFNFCSVVDSAPCIADVLFKKDENWISAEFLRYVDMTPDAAAIEQVTRETENAEGVNKKEILQIGKGSSWKPNTKLGLPGSATGPILLRFPGLKNKAGTDTYVLNSRYEFTINLKNDAITNVQTDKVDMNLRAYKEFSTPGQRMSVETVIRDFQGKRSIMGSGTGSNMEIAWVERDKTAFAAAFSDTTSFQVKMKLPSEIVGWFHGRLQNSDIEVSKIDSKTNFVTVRGEPIDVPVTAAWVEKFAPENKELLDMFNLSAERIAAEKADEANGKVGILGTGWSPGSDFYLYNKWESRLGDRAKGSFNVWYVGTLPNWETAKSPCLNKSDSLQGMISTNAMIYQAGLPEFLGGFLNYKVAGLHYAADGSVFSGTYDLIMKSQAARCLYGFSSAPVSGTVSVVSVDGEQKVATTTVGESGGWLRLSAKNFSFSQNTIKMKLTQKKTSISCVSQKSSRIVKKVTAISPKCPSGFKLKKSA